MKAGDKGRKGQRTKLSYERRLNLAAASAATLYALPSVVSAAIVHVSGAPVSQSATGPAPGSGIFDESMTWDVDGDSNPDFDLRKKGNIATDGPTLRSATGYIYLNSLSTAAYAPLNGNGVVQGILQVDTRAIKTMAPGKLVGPTLATSYQYKWGNPGQTDRTMMSFFSTTSGTATSNGASVVGQANNGGFAGDQLQYFGFSFTSGGNTFFGWAAILHALGSDRRLEIVEWPTTIPQMARSKSQPYRYRRTDWRCWPRVQAVCSQCAAGVVKLNTAQSWTVPPAFSDVRAARPCNQRSARAPN